MELPCLRCCARSTSPGRWRVCSSVDSCRPRYLGTKRPFAGDTFVGRAGQPGFQPALARRRGPLLGQFASPYLARSRYRRTRDFALSATGDARGPALAALLVSPKTTLDEKEKAVRALAEAWPDAVRLGGKPVIRELKMSIPVESRFSLWPKPISLTFPLGSIALPVTSTAAFDLPPRWLSFPQANPGRCAFWSPKWMKSAPRRFLQPAALWIDCPLGKPGAFSRRWCGMARPILSLSTCSSICPASAS